MSDVDDVLRLLDEATTEEDKLEIEAAYLEATDNSVKDGDPDQEGNDV